MNIGAAALLVMRMLLTRPRRTGLLFLGYGLGVAVMVALLAVGDALLIQAQDKDVVSGGDVVLLPEGINPEVLKVGGVSGMFLSIPNARYVVRQLLLGPRFVDVIVSASPELADKLIYVRKGGSVYAALARADLPELARQTHSATAIESPAWTDTEEDRAWIAPSAQQRLAEEDRFHVPVQGSARRSWAEWWYFNVTGPDGLIGYFSFSADRDRRARILVSVQLPGGRLLRWSEQHPGATIPLEGSSFRAGRQSVVLADGSYQLHVAHGDFLADLRITPIPGLDFPPIERRVGTFQSGYVVPALRAKVTGHLHIGATQFRVEGIGYHDHNWGLWKDVTWEWGTGSNPSYALLAGLIHHPTVVGQEMFVSLYAADPSRPGVLAILRATAPVLDAWQDRPVAGRVLRVPGRLQYRATNEVGDELTVMFLIDNLIATPAERVAFLQLHGRYRISGNAGGKAIEAEMPGFAETFVPVSRQ